MSGNSFFAPKGPRAGWNLVKFPWYIKRELAAGITVHRFYRDSEDKWLESFPPGTPLHAIFELMYNDGVYTMVEILEAQTSVLSPPGGTGIFNPVEDLSRYPVNSIVVNFSFYVHCRNLFRRSEGEMPLGPEGHHYPVGECSYTDKFIPVSKSYKDLFVPRVMTDSSYATAGPSLNEPLDMRSPNHAQINTSKGRFQYFRPTPESQPCANPVWKSLEQSNFALRNVVNIKQVGKGQIEATPLVPGSTVSVKAEIEGFLSHGKTVERWPNCAWALATNMTPHINAVIKDQVGICAGQYCPCL